jgi:hypothetical protein
MPLKQSAAGQWKNWPYKPKNWGWAIKRSRYTVILDACVLYPAPLRDFIIELAAGGLFRARWTPTINDEWISNLLNNRADLTEAQIFRTRNLMNAAVPDCLVDPEAYVPLVEALTLPDPDDRHVLAAAIATGADAIVTFNLKDFPPAALIPYGVDLLHPDDFIFHQFGLSNAAVLAAALHCRERLENPRKAADEYLDTLEKQGLPKTVAELRDYTAVI